MNEYERLMQYVNDNLAKKSHQKITFESLNNLEENLHAFPIEKLMSIADDKVFIYEIHYKLLSRMPQRERVTELLNILKHNNKENRMQIIRDIYHSEERQVKSTQLIFTKEYTL